MGIRYDLSYDYKNIFPIFKGKPFLISHKIVFKTFFYDLRLKSCFKVNIHLLMLQTLIKEIF